MAPWGQHVSLSHSSDRVVVAVTTLGPVGVDVERHGAVTFTGFEDVALAASERAELGRIPTGLQRQARTVWWVRKEAVLKAAGHGLLTSPCDIVVTGPPSPPRLLAWTAADPPQLPVQLADVSVGGGYAACVALIAGRAPTVLVTDASGWLAGRGEQAGTARRRTTRPATMS